MTVEQSKEVLVQPVPDEMIATIRERMEGREIDAFKPTPQPSWLDVGLLLQELDFAKGRLSDSPTWIKFDSMDHATDPKDGETVLGWWAPVAATGYRGGMESVTFGAADEDGRSDTWTNAFGDSTDPPDYWTRLRGPK